MIYRHIAILVMLGSSPVTASAADDAPCPANLICASNPESVVNALQDAGYQAKLEKDSAGTFIKSAAVGYKFYVNMGGCAELIKCDSLTFSSAFAAKAHVTASFANEYNSLYRYVRAAVLKNGNLRLSYDVSTIGGLTKPNFDSAVSRYTQSLANYLRFERERAATVFEKK